MIIYIKSKLDGYHVLNFDNINFLYDDGQHIAYQCNNDRELRYINCGSRNELDRIMKAIENQVAKNS